MRINGTIWFESSHGSMLTERDMLLLEKIREIGSLTQAAKSIGISYKTAWESLDKINKFSKKPIVETCAGGKGGGNSILTTQGVKILATYHRLKEQQLSLLANWTKDLTL